MTLSGSKAIVPKWLYCLLVHLNGQALYKAQNNVVFTTEKARERKIDVAVYMY